MSDVELTFLTKKILKMIILQGPVPSKIPRGGSSLSYSPFFVSIFLVIHNQNIEFDVSS